MEEPKSSKIIKNSVIISGIVCLGKLLGFLKQAVLAWAFGANGTTDVYFAADSYIVMFAQIQTVSIAPSVLTEYVFLDETKKKRDLEYFLRKSFVIFPTIALVLILINILLSGQISMALGISYSLDQRQELQKLMICLCPVIFFASFSGVSNGILDANEKFAPSKFLSLFFSTAIIVSVILLHDRLGIESMLIGFLFGYGVHAVYVTLLAKKYFSFGKIRKRDKSFNRAIRRIFPLVVGNAVVDIGNLVDKIIASSLVTGSVTYLYYGQVISNDLVNSVIITSIGTVLLPSLARMVVNGCEGKKVANRISEIIGIEVSILLAIDGLFIVEGIDFVRLFFERGSFSPEATWHVSGIAICYAVGFIFIAIREVLAKTHYAYQDTKTPMRNGIIGVIINIVLSLVLSRFIGVFGIALATSISMIFVSIMMCFSVKRHIGVYPLNKLFWISLIKALISMGVMVLFGFLLRFSIEDLNYVARMFCVAGTMLFVYLMGLIIMKHNVINQIKSLTSKRK